MIENDVFKSYAEILQKFGVTIQAPGGPGDANYWIGTEGQEDRLFVGDRLPGSTVRKVLGWQGSGSDHYPAADEIAALRKKTIPDGVGFVYSATCLENGEPVFSDTDCKEYDPSTVEMTFWRPMRRDDLGNYANIKAYNRTLSQFKSELRARGQRKTLTDDPLRGTDLCAEAEALQVLCRRWVARRLRRSFRGRRRRLRRGYDSRHRWFSSALGQRYLSRHRLD